jgi:hypothetical protein
MSAGTIIGLVYLAGFFVSGYVYRARAGAGVMGRIAITGPGGFGVGWFLLLMCKAVLWPIVLVVWLATGRPEPRIVFNEKAEARRRQQQVTAQPARVATTPAQPLSAKRPTSWTCPGCGHQNTGSGKCAGCSKFSL